MGDFKRKKKKSCHLSFKKLVKKKEPPPTATISLDSFHCLKSHIICVDCIKIKLWAITVSSNQEFTLCWILISWLECSCSDARSPVGALSISPHSGPHFPSFTWPLHHRLQRWVCWQAHNLHILVTVIPSPAVLTDPPSCGGSWVSCHSA